MEKYLFTDGTNGVREVQSQEELQNLIESATRPDAIRIWIFSSNEWISYDAFRKQVPSIVKKEKPSVISNGPSVTNNQLSSRAEQGTATKKNWLKKTLYIAAAAAGVFLVFNFTKIKWEKADPVNITAARPLNVPQMDIDSLVDEIEYSRNQALDRNTKNNLRLRNTWPDRIELRLHSEKETSTATSRYSKVDLSIDNSTGFNIDNAVVKLMVWKDNKVSTTDTFRFSNIRYDKLLTRQLDDTYKGDSISVSFESIKAKAFNFCYSAATKNNSGNYNDRWFCRE
jgi:hypothetical protein